MKNNNKNTILLITHSYDLHVDVLTKHLTQMGESFFRLNLDHFPRDYDINFHTDGRSSPQYQLSYITQNQMIECGQIKSVWVRKKAPFAFVSDDLGAQELKYAQTECEHLLFGFLTSLDCYWMSHPKAMRAAQWKVEQLARANRFGFITPATLITNAPEKLLQFYHHHKQQIITKPICEASLEVDNLQPEEVLTNGVSTAMVSEEHIEHIAAVREFPCLFQAYVEKQYELRVTVIGNKLFTAKIDSQADERTRVDFRDFSVEIDYQACRLPDEVASSCLEYVHSYGLQYGALDLIFTPEGEYVFLENNPGGQFWFVEQLVPELQMMSQVADCLARGRI